MGIPGTIQPSAGYFSLVVGDTGCGIQQEIIDRIFDPYFTTKDVGEGMGLGLSIVHSLVRKHEGIVRVFGRSGIGSEFHVLLPLYANENKT